MNGLIQVLAERRYFVRLCHVNACFQPMNLAIMIKTSIGTPHHFHSDIIPRAVWMYFRLKLSFRDI